ncbi:hypothetical protein, partial [Salmonella enterica]|uniref:hypothetical protein n=1 Tax=Salmonella enterica TaxID=28901 RepID=UPI003075C206
YLVLDADTSRTMLPWLLGCYPDGATSTMHPGVCFRHRSCISIGKYLKTALHLSKTLVSLL